MARRFENLSDDDSTSDEEDLNRKGRRHREYLGTVYLIEFYMTPLHSFTIPI
jgi:hypothetical protein